MIEVKVTATPDKQDEEFVINSLWQHNSHFHPVDIQPLFVTAVDEKQNIIGGLVARTWWGGLDIQYLWVDRQQRKKGVGNYLMEAAEQEAIRRGCHMAYVDTLSFQAKGFYEKRNYTEYGQLDDYAHRYTRHYLAKPLTNYGKKTN